MMSHPWYWKPLKGLVYPFGRTPLMGSVESVGTRDPVVALTFDDGPDPATTPLLLDLLEKHGAHATFFVVGEAAAAQPALLDRIHEEGHALANHGWSHLSLPTLARAAQVSELRRCAQVLGARGTKLFRPPYGHQTPASRWWVGRHGYRVVIWSAQVQDWRHQDATRLTGRLRDALSPGAIILLHDAIRVSPGVVPPDDLEPDRTHLFTALDRLLTEVGDEFEFVTVPELMSRGRAQWTNWFRFDTNVA
jgi:peptidoglycan/xylan/chitin deacetylase (PgdA/CDA1 family)